MLGRLPKIENQVDIQIAMKDLYEHRFGIYRHLGSGSDRPLSSVAFHPSEDINTNSYLEESMNNYINYRVNDYFKITYLEYMNLTRDVIQMMHRIARKHSMAEKAKNDAVASQMGLPPS